jgi:hypothetical protein
MLTPHARAHLGMPRSRMVYGPRNTNTIGAITNPANGIFSFTEFSSGVCTLKYCVVEVRIRSQPVTAAATDCRYWQLLLAVSSIAALHLPGGCRRRYCCLTSALC